MTMMVDAHLTDGRTVFRAQSRGQVIALFKRDPETIDENDAKPIRVWARWHPQDEFVPIRLASLKKHSVQFIRVVERDEQEEFLRSQNLEPARA